MVELPEEFVMDRIIESGKVAQELGAKIVGLGAFTSIDIHCFHKSSRGIS